MKTFINSIFLSLLIISGILMVACNSSKEDSSQLNLINEAEVLLQYLEENGNIVNHPDIPYFVSAEEVYSNLRASNYLVIDLRSEEDFNQGHIESAVQVLPRNILEYFENRIEPNSFTKIVLVCENAHLSGYTAAILRMLGYTNVFTMRFGLSSWNEVIAENFWLSHISSDMLGKLETTPNEKKGPGALPVIKTGAAGGYEILRQRAAVALSVDWDDNTVTAQDIYENPDPYYLANYWPQDLYEMGHLPGAIQYNPKKSLHSTQDILTLPTDKPIIFYCYSGQNSAWVNAFLSLMGYDFRSLDYGANGFIYQVMVDTQRASRSFSAQHIKNYPLVTSDSQGSVTGMTPSVKVETSTVQGGC